VREYGIDEATTKLPDLIKQVQRGERVTITNRGEPVADLVPSASGAARQTHDALIAIIAIKAMMAGQINQVEFTEMRLRGRRLSLSCFLMKIVRMRKFIL
jgi:prevent-host-death family protein